MRRGEVPQKYIWEGKILNKISKKIISLVTMAAFVLTLVPAAAFAANGVASAKESTFTVSASTVGIGDAVTVTANINDADAESTNQQMTNVKIWVTKEGSDEVVKNASIYSTTSGDWDTATKDGIVSGGLTNAQEFHVAFAELGDYTIHIGQVQQDPANKDYVEELKATNSANVNVNEVINKVELTAQNNDTVFPGNSDTDTLTGNEDSTTVNLDRADLLPNSIIEYTITGVAYEGYEANGSTGNIVAGETFNVTSNSDKLVVSDSTVTSGANGSFDINFSVKKAGNYKITLHNSDINYTINVVYKSTNAEIETVTSNGETLLAGNDTQNYVGDNRPANYAAAVEFEITDPDGGVVTGPDALINEPAARVTATNGHNHADFLKIDSKPDDSKLAASDLILVANNDSYTLQYVGDNAAADLIPGEYTVTVSLLNGEYATAKMTFAKYGTTQNVVLDMTAVPTSNTPTGDAVQSETITDQVKLGRTVTVQAKYVDENGVKINAQDVTYGFDGKAVDSTFVGTNQFQTRADQMFNESLLGTTINVTAFDSNKKEIASQKLTVVDAYTENSLAFDKTSGEVDTNNNVTVSVVDADGNVVPVTGNLDAYVADQSNVDADVTVKVAKDMTNGKDGKLILNSDKATTADIVVSVKAGNAQYYGTLNYTFGDVNGVGTSVVMTIGSSEYVVNNELVTGDAAPYVADSRTMVPIRALTEAFGAKVDYDNDARTVTIVNNDTTIVMTVGETTYTVNDAEKTMDVAPVIGSGDRAYVPVRFVAEALGYEVTPLYAADGTTASVYFTM